MNKPIEYWIALATGILIVIERNRAKPAATRVLIAAISGGIGHSLASEASQWLSRSETLTVMILTASGYLLMDIFLSLVSDREWLKGVIKDRISGGK